MKEDTKKKDDKLNKKDAERKAALQTAIKNIEKAHGKGTIMKLGETLNMNVEVTKTGSLGLDVALGVGGIPKGRVIEIYGHESSGKTTLALHMIAEVQKAGGVAAFIDAEHALDPTYAKAIGVNIEELYISQPDHGEQALAIAETMVSSGAVDILVIDSVAALVPKAEIEGTMSDLQVGLQARLMSKGLRKLTGIMNKQNCTVIFLNQLRDKIATSYGGGGETTAGGRALKFYASVRMEVKKKETLKQGDDQVGNKVQVKIVKNKVAPPFKIVLFDILFGKGISTIGEIMDVALDTGIIEKSGSWFSYGDRKLGQGKENVRDLIANEEALRKEIEEKVRALGPEQLLYKSKKKKSKKGSLASTTLDDSLDLDDDFNEEDLDDDLDLDLGDDEDILNDTGDDLDKSIDYIITDEEV